MYKEQGDLSKALAHADRALTQDKYFIVAMINQADTYSNVGIYFHLKHAEFGYNMLLRRFLCSLN